MEEIRLLFTNEEKQRNLIQAFQEAALAVDKNLKIYGIDSAEICEVGSEKDINDISMLAEICRKEKINLLIPANDMDLLALAKNREAFVGTRVLLSRDEVISICKEIELTIDLFEGCGYRTPKICRDWTQYDGEFPCFIMPKEPNGQSSYVVFDWEELELYVNRMEEYVIRPFIKGVEYVVDIFCDFEGNPILITPRICWKTQSKDSFRTQIVMDEQVITECRRIVEKLKPSGPITIHLIRGQDTGENYFLEINPCYDEDVVLSMQAGAKSAEVLLSLMMDMDVKAVAYPIRDGAVYSYAKQIVCIEQGEYRQKIG